MSVSTDRARQVFLLPDLGEGLAEAEVVAWKVALGDTVVIDQVVVEVETAKAVVEVPTPYAGVVEALHGVAGATVIVGSPLITIAATAGAAVPSAPGTPPSHEQHREEERAGSGNVLIGYGTSEASTPRRRRVRPDATEPSARAEAPPATTTPRAAPAPTARVLSPVVRKLARENNLDISTLDGSGLGGVIRRCDVEAAISMGAPRPAAEAPDGGEPAPVERIPLTGFRKAVADKLSTSRREIPDATTWVDVDATELMNARRAINASLPDEPISLLALLARLCIAGLAEFPELNSTVDNGRQEILRYRHVNLGIAAHPARIGRPRYRRGRHPDHRRAIGGAPRDDDTGQGRQAHTRPPRRRHVHIEQLRRVRGRWVHADHQPPRSGDPRHRSHREQALGLRQSGGGAQGHPAVADLRPPRR